MYYLYFIINIKVTKEQNLLADILEKRAFRYLYK